MPARENTSATAAPADGVSVRYCGTPLGLVGPARRVRTPDAPPYCISPRVVIWFTIMQFKALPDASTPLAACPAEHKDPAVARAVAVPALPPIAKFATAVVLETTNGAVPVVTVD